MHYTQYKSLPGTGAGKKEVGDTQAPLDFFSAKILPWKFKGSLTGACLFHDISAEILLRRPC